MKRCSVSYFLMSALIIIVLTVDTDHGGRAAALKKTRSGTSGGAFRTVLVMLVMVVMIMMFVMVKHHRVPSKSRFRGRG
jgi:hypothetical protein